MPSAKDVYRAEKARAEADSRALEERRRQDERQAKADSEAERQKLEAIWQNVQALERQEDQVAREYLDKKVAPVLRELAREVHGKVRHEDNDDGTLHSTERGLVLEVSRRRKSDKSFGPHSHYIETTGVFVEVRFDASSQGHLYVNDELTDPSDLPAALGKAAANPDVHDSGTRGGWPSEPEESIDYESGGSHHN